MPLPITDYWSVTQTAEYLGLSRTRTIQLCHNGQLPFIRYGSQRLHLIDPADVRKYAALRKAVDDARAVLAGKRAS